MTEHSCLEGCVHGYQSCVHVSSDGVGQSNLNLCVHDSHSIYYTVPNELTRKGSKRGENSFF
jgi:hypothetical protein